MGVPHADKRPNTVPNFPAYMPPIRSVRVRQGTMQPPRKPKALDSTPGPGHYYPCNSQFCACHSCDGIHAGKSFGLRPSVYTGNIPWPAPPAPNHYHVDCTTLGAATQVCPDMG